MKAHLLYRDADFDLEQAPPPCAEDVVQDLELTTLFAAMARDDKYLAEVIPKVVLAGSTDIDTILYRQNILRDCLEREEVVRSIYALAVETIEAERKNYLSYLLRSPNFILHRSVEVMEMFVGMLRRLRAIADQNIASFASEGFRALFSMLQQELGNEYFDEVQHHLRQLRFPHGVLLSARLGAGNRGTDYVLRKDNPPQGSWLTRLMTSSPPSYSFKLHPRDESGARALSELRDRGINLAANALAQSAEHILSFFQMLRMELAFYVGCLNLRARLSVYGEPICMPEPARIGSRQLSATRLYDVCLALTKNQSIVDNDLHADGKDLIIITGANTGGKSTTLRSIGLAQVMMQCGMFVPASTYRGEVCARILTHYKREEDATMKSGKFDEELSRMSRVVDSIMPDTLMMFNESFSSTNEREGSEIGRQIVTALLDRQVKVAFVTHQYEFAGGFSAQGLPNALFLRAEREADGARTFKIREGEPLRTSFGQDLYRRIFLGDKGPEDEGAAARVSVPIASTN
jgi:DNA mismatch repair ATPase MutS